MPGPYPISNMHSASYVHVQKWDPAKTGELFNSRENYAKLLIKQ